MNAGLIDSVKIALVWALATPGLIFIGFMATRMTNDQAWLVLGSILAVVYNLSAYWIFRALKDLSTQKNILEEWRFENSNRPKDEFMDEPEVTVRPASEINR